MKRDKLGAQKGNHEGRQAWESKQPRREIMKSDKLERQGGKQQPGARSGSQEQPRMEIMKGDQLGSRPEWRCQDFPSALFGFRVPPLASSCVALHSLLFKGILYSSQDGAMLRQVACIGTKAFRGTNRAKGMNSRAVKHFLRFAIRCCG